MSPAVVLGLVFLVTPIIMSVFYSFTDFVMTVPGEMHFVGFKNFANIFDDPLFYTSIKNTLLFVMLTVPIQIVLAVALAVLVNKRSFGFQVFKLAYFAPVITSMTVVALLFDIFYRTDGVFNILLTSLGFATQPFLNSSTQAMESIAFMSVWQGVGYQMIIILAGLQGVPKELYEAAELDGAGAWQKFRNITVAGITPVLSFVMIITFTGAVKMFVQSQIMTQGGPGDSTYTLVYYIYQYAMGDGTGMIGYASAVSVILTLAFVIGSVAKSLITAGVRRYGKYREKVLENV